MFHPPAPSRLPAWPTVLAVGLVLALAGAAAAHAQGAQEKAGGNVDAAQIANSGLVNQGTPACASCHGFRGEGVRVQNGPRLAGLDPDYLERQLDAFKHGGRDSSVMTWVARTLTADQRQALAQYYAALPPSDAAPAAGGMVAEGRDLALRGNWSEKLPPCASCHAADGLGVGSLVPPLAGQRADYIARQLVGFRQNGRRDDPLGLMRSVAGRMSPREIKAVAAYYATLPGRAAPQKPALPSGAKPALQGARR